MVFLKNLGLKNCLQFQVGKTTIMLDNFKNFYNGGYGSDNIILKLNLRTLGEKYFSLGAIFEDNKIIEDLKNNQIEVESLYSYIKEKIYERVLEGLFNYVETNKENTTSLFNRNDIYLFYNYSEIGKNPITKIRENIKFNLDFEKLVDDEIIIDSWYGNGGSKDIKYLIYNIYNDDFYINDDIINKKKQADLILNHFTTQSDRNEYMLYHKYINNKLSGENLAYKEIADLNKWLQQDDKKTISVIYELNGEEKEEKIKNDINRFISDLPKEYYEEMFSFYGIDEITSIKQIKGFKYKKDFYKLNVENLLYKKEEK